PGHGSRATSTCWSSSPYEGEGGERPIHRGSGVARSAGVAGCAIDPSGPAPISARRRRSGVDMCVPHVYHVRNAHNGGQVGRRTGIHGGGTALFRLVRFWARRWVLHAAGSTAERARVRHLLLLEAV